MMNILTKKSFDIDERENLFRLVEYSLNLLKAARGVPRLKGEIDAIDNVQLIRQALRFGKCLDSFNTSMANMAKIKNNVFRIAMSLSKISESIYFFLDHLIWLSKMGILNLDNERFSNFANLYLLYARLLTLLKNLYQMNAILSSRYYKTDRYTEKVGLVGHVKHFVSFNKALSLDIVGNTCDILLCLHRLERVRLGSVKMSLVGILSSILPFFRYKNNILL